MLSARRRLAPSGTHRQWRSRHQSCVAASHTITLPIGLPLFGHCHGHVGSFTCGRGAPAQRDHGEPFRGSAGGLDRPVADDGGRERGGSVSLGRFKRSRRPRGLQAVQRSVLVGSIGVERSDGAHSAPGARAAASGIAARVSRIRVLPIAMPPSKPPPPRGATRPQRAPAARHGRS